MKNRNRYLYFLTVGIILLFTSCEDVIDLNLKNTDPVIVIEAKVTNRLENQVIKISQTQPFDRENAFVAINNAVVTVTEVGGPTYNFTQTNNGYYSSAAFSGIPGKTYRVQVVVNNKTYTAESTMPQVVNLDSLTVTELSFFGERRKYIQVNYKDTPNIANQYNYVLTVNGKVRNGYYVDSDRFNDGNNIINTIFNDDPELTTGDRVEVDFQCIDLPIYRYFFAITQINGNGGPPTAPANPDSNFNNGALGYFSAHTSQKVSLVIP
jgi:hypothetical protein